MYFLFFVSTNSSSTKIFKSSIASFETFLFSFKYVKCFSVYFSISIAMLSYFVVCIKNNKKYKIPQKNKKKIILIMFFMTLIFIGGKYRTRTYDTHNVNVML